MPYVAANFGNGGSNVVRQVNTQFGPRDTGGSIGNVKVSGQWEQITFELTGAQINQTTPFPVKYKLPVGAIVRDVQMQVTEAFVVTGTTPALEIGTDTTEVTNGFTVTEAQLEAVATVNLTSALSGTWASPIATAVDIDLALSGTTPVVSSAVGRAKFVIQYSQVK